MKTWPRLSEVGTFKHPRHCQSCGATYDREIWQECDDKDEPEQIFIILCDKCSEKIIGPHPRLYRMLHRNAPAPGAMLTCADCDLSVGVNCTSFLLKKNGGPGLPLRLGEKSTIHIDRVVNGRRVGEWHNFYSSPPTCDDKGVIETKNPPDESSG